MILLILVILFALAFDFINGFHDAANSIATIVSTKVLTPLQAVIWAASFNFIAYIIFDLNVADTVAKVADTLSLNLMVILAGLTAAIVWNLFTWYSGIPSSSSHTLIGGFAGAAIAHAGFSVVNFEVLVKIVSFIFLAPIIGMIISIIITVIIMHLSKKARPYKADQIFKKLQLVSSALFSIGHGGNDSQKIMGIISVAIVVFGMQNNIANIPEHFNIDYEINGGKISIHHIPAWIPLACYSVIALGTLSGGWRIVKTMGTKITKVTPLEGVAAETAGAITLITTEQLGIPVSTTHTITGSIIGVGLVKRVSAVRWGFTLNLLWAWVLTVPISALIAVLIYYLYVLLNI